MAPAPTDDGHPTGRAPKDRKAPAQVQGTLGHAQPNAAVELAVPPSKSQLQRALIACAWSGQTVRLDFAAPFEEWSDAGLDVAQLAALVARTGQLRNTSTPGFPHSWELRAEGWRELREVHWKLGESGTSARFLWVALALAGHPGHERSLDVSGSLRTRQSPALAASLAQAGAGDGSPGGGWPIRVTSFANPGAFSLLQPTSSQEVSALLLGLGFEGGGQLEVFGKIPSEPYVGLTRDLLERLGARIEVQPLPVPASAANGAGSSQGVGSGGTRFRVFPWRPQGTAVSLAIEPDASAAAVAWAAGLLAKRPVTVAGWLGEGQQGDLAFLDQVAQAGAEVRRSPEGRVTVAGGLRRGVDLDLSATPDLAPVWAALAAALAHGHWGSPAPSRLVGLAGLERKESPRLSVLAEILSALGLAIKKTSDSLEVPVGRLVRPQGPLDPVGDHRMAFALGLLRWVLPELRVANADCVQKSWPGFWACMERLRFAPEP